MNNKEFKEFEEFNENMKNKKIKIKIVNVYGVDRIYPVCENAKIFCLITKRRTLMPETIGHIKSLGYAVKVVLDDELIKTLKNKKEEVK
jgi:hypothetical protein